MKEMMDGFPRSDSNSFGPDLKTGIQKVEECLEQVQKAMEIYRVMKPVNIVLQRSALKNEAIKSTSKIKDVHQYFQVGSVKTLKMLSIAHCCIDTSS